METSQQPRFLAYQQPLEQRYYEYEHHCFPPTPITPIMDNIPPTPITGGSEEDSLLYCYEQSMNNRSSSYEHALNNYVYMARPLDLDLDNENSQMSSLLYQDQFSPPLSNSQISSPTPVQTSSLPAFGHKTSSSTNKRNYSHTRTHTQNNITNAATNTAIAAHTRTATISVPTATTTDMTNSTTNTTTTTTIPTQVSIQLHAPSKRKKRHSCPHPQCHDINGCPTTHFTREADVKRHIKSRHDRVYSDCPVRGCTRKGARGFTRKDHLNDHVRNVHLVERNGNGFGNGVGNGGAAAEEYPGHGQGQGQGQGQAPRNRVGRRVRVNRGQSGSGRGSWNGSGTGSCLEENDHEDEVEAWQGSLSPSSGSGSGSGPGSGFGYGGGGELGGDVGGMGVMGGRVGGGQGLFRSQSQSQSHSEELHALQSGHLGALQSGHLHLVEVDSGSTCQWPWTQGADNGSYTYGVV